MANLIALQDAAKEYDVHRVTLHRYIRSGKLTAYKKGFDHKTFLDIDELNKVREAQPA